MHKRELVPDESITAQNERIRELENQMRQLLAERSQSTRASPPPLQQTVQATGEHATVNQIQQLHVTSCETTNNTKNEVRNEVTVNIFGQERVDHITAPQIYELLMNARSAADPGIQALLDAALVVFSDPAKPENITCFLPNKKTSDALVHEASGWQIKPIEAVLSPMVQKSVDVLFRKQPYGHEEGLPEQPDISSCGEVLKRVAALETDPVLSKKTTAPHGPMRTVLVRNKCTISKANGGSPPGAGEA